MKNRCPKHKNTTQKSPIRHTYSTASGLEDAIAVAWGIILEQQRSLAYAESRARRVVEILQAVRAGPHAYDPEQDSGKKIKIKRR